MFEKTPQPHDSCLCLTDVPNTTTQRSKNFYAQERTEKARVVVTKFSYYMRTLIIVQHRFCFMISQIQNEFNN